MHQVFNKHCLQPGAMKLSPIRYMGAKFVITKFGDKKSRKSSLCRFYF